MNPWLSNQTAADSIANQDSNQNSSQHEKKSENKDKSQSNTNKSKVKEHKTTNPPNAWGIPNISEKSHSDVKIKQRDSKKKSQKQTSIAEGPFERDNNSKNKTNRERQSSHTSKSYSKKGNSSHNQKKLSKYKSLLPSTVFTIINIKQKVKAVVLTLEYDTLQLDMIIPSILNSDPTLTTGMKIELIHFNLNKSQVNAINENRAPAIGGQNHGNIRSFKILSPFEKLKELTSYDTRPNNDSRSNHQDHAWKPSVNRNSSTFSPQKSNRKKYLNTGADNKSKRSRSAGHYNGNNSQNSNSSSSYYPVPFKPYFKKRMPPRLSLGKLRSSAKHISYPPTPYSPVQLGNCYQIISKSQDDIRIPLYEDQDIFLISDGDSYIEALLPKQKEHIYPLMIIDIKQYEVRYVQGMSIMFVEKYEIEKKVVPLIGHPWPVNLDTPIRTVKPLCNATSKSRDAKFRDIKPRKDHHAFTSFQNREINDFSNLKPNFESEFWALHSYHNQTTELAVFYFQSQDTCYIYDGSYEKVKHHFEKSESEKKDTPKLVTIDDVPMVQFHTLEFLSEVLYHAKIHFNVFYIKSFILNPPSSIIPVHRNPITVRHRVPLRIVFERLNRTKVLRRLLSKLFYPLDFSKGKKTVLITMLMHYLFEEGKILFLKHLFAVPSLKEDLIAFQQNDFLHMDEDSVRLFFKNKLDEPAIQRLSKAFMIPNSHHCDMVNDLLNEIYLISYMVVLNNMEIDLLLEICNQMFINFKSWVSSHSQNRDCIIQYILAESFPWMLQPCDLAYDALAGTIAHMVKHHRSRIMGTFGNMEPQRQPPPSTVTISAINREIKLEEVHASPPSSVPMGELSATKSPLTSSMQSIRDKKVEQVGRSRSRSNASPLLLTNDLVINDSAYIAIPHHDDMNIGLVYRWKPEKREILFSPDGSSKEHYEITSATMLTSSTPAIHSVELGDLVEFNVVDGQCQIVSILQRRDLKNGGDIELYLSQYLKYQTSTFIQDDTFLSLCSSLKESPLPFTIPKDISSFPPQISHRVFRGQIVKYSNLNGLLKVDASKGLGVEFVPFFSVTTHLRVGDQVRFQVFFKNLLLFAHRLHRVARSVTFKVPNTLDPASDHSYFDSLSGFEKPNEEVDDESSSDSDDEDTDIKNASDVEDFELPRSSVDITQIEDMLQANRSRSGSIVQSPLMFSQIKDLAIGHDDDDDETEGELDDEEAEAQIEEMFGMLALDEEEDLKNNAPCSPDYKPFLSLEMDMLQDKYDTHERKEIIVISNPQLPLYSPSTPSFMPMPSFIPFSDSKKK